MPPSACWKRPTRSRSAPVKADLDVAEQLRFEEPRGQGGAVDLDERPVGPGAGRVDRLGDQLLAGPALAEDQDRRRAGRGLADRRQHPPDGRARTADPGQGLGLGRGRAAVGGGRLAVAVGAVVAVEELVLEDEDPPLLLGDLLDLVPQLAVQLVEGPVDRRRVQRQGRDGGQGPEEDELLVVVGQAAPLRPEDQDAGQLVARRSTPRRPRRPARSRHRRPGRTAIGRSRRGAGRSAARGAGGRSGGPPAGRRPRARDRARRPPRRGRPGPSRR